MKLGPMAWMVLGICATLALGQEKPGPGVVPVDKDDAKMKAAMEKARATVKPFIAAMQEPKAGQVGFSVKVPFTEEGATEHMWLRPLSFDGKNFQGKVNNEPKVLKKVKLGQSVTIAPEKISDWMYFDKKKLVGGYTLRALRDSLTPAERAEFDKDLPFEID